MFMLAEGKEGICTLQSLWCLYGFEVTVTWVGGFGHGTNVFMCIKSKDIEAFDALC